MNRMTSFGNFVSSLSCITLVIVMLFATPQIAYADEPDIPCSPGTCDTGCTANLGPDCVNPNPSGCKSDTTDCPNCSCNRIASSLSCECQGGAP